MSAAHNVNQNSDSDDTADLVEMISGKCKEVISPETTSPEPDVDIVHPDVAHFPAEYSVEKLLELQIKDAVVGKDPVYSLTGKKAPLPVWKELVPFQPRPSLAMTSGAGRQSTNMAEVFERKLRSSWLTRSLPRKKMNAFVQSRLQVQWLKMARQPQGLSTRCA